MGLWNRLFGKKGVVPVPRATVNSSRPVQRPSSVAPQQSQSSPEPPAPKSPGIAAMLNVCSNRRSRLLSLMDDPSFNQAVEELKREGPTGAQALAALVDELLAARCAEIQDVLVAAGRIPPQPELVSAIQRVISAPPIVTGQAGGSQFPPVIVGGGRIGWDDTAAARIKKAASKALNSLGVSTEPQIPLPEASVPKIPAEKQAPQDSNIISVTCSKCNREYRLGVDAAVVSDDGVGASFGVVVGSYTGGTADSPDLVASLSPGSTPTLNTLKEVARLERIRAAGTSRYWQCNLCKTVYPYPWARQR
jgi:hypothetical protein